MITLPNVVLTSDSDTGSSALRGGKGGDAAQDFMALLGQQLADGTLKQAGGKSLTLAGLQGEGKAVSLAQLQAAGKAAASQLAADADADAPLTGIAADVASLLARLPDGLSARLPGAEKDDALPAASDETKPLNNQDMAALSALFAMLPQVPQQTPKGGDAKAQPELALNASGLLSGNTLTAGNGKADSKAAIKGDTGHDTRIDTTGSTPLANVPASLAASAAVVTSGNTSEKTYTEGNGNHNLTLTSASFTPHGLSQNLASPSATPLPQVSAQLGTPEWQQSVSQQITLFTRQGQHSAELRLHPEELGAIQISLRMDDNQAQLQLVSPHSHVRAALEAALPTLRAQLAESGIQLGQSNISGESFAGQQQGQQQQQQGSRSSGGFSLSGGEETPVIVPASLQAAARGDGAVDIFA